MASWTALACYFQQKKPKKLQDCAWTYMYSGPFSRYDAVYSFMNGTCHREYTKLTLYLGKCTQEAAICNTKQLWLPHSGFKVNINCHYMVTGLEEAQKLQRLWPLHRLALNKFRKIFYQLFTNFDLNCWLCQVNV